MTRGFIVGKFWPPHRGHRYLIETAFSQVDELYVMVCLRPHEVPRGELRVAWLRELLPAVRFFLIDDKLGDYEYDKWAESTVRCLGFVPDVVFCSEDYGEPFAAYLGCRHVVVDKARVAVPVAGRKVRENPFEWWDYLDPVVRAYYVKRICLVGAESTGKTTLAAQLAEYFQTNWVPEYGRAYCAEKFAAEPNAGWSSEEFAHIARTQCEHEDAAARQANKTLFCDTDAFVTSVWHERYLGEPSPQVEAIATEHPCPDLYLLTDVDTPFVQDGTRDGEAIREWMHARFMEKMTAQGRPFVVLQGSFEERFEQAVAAVNEVLQKPQRDAANAR